MFSCKKASRLVSEALERDLSRGERFSLRFHLCICNMCRRYRKQTRFLQEAGRELRETLETSDSEERLSPQVRERIREALEREQG